MGVSVKVALTGDLLQVRVREFVGETGEIVVDPAYRRDLVDLDALDALRGQHAMRRVRIDDTRYQDVRKRCANFAERRGVARFRAVIELVDERAFHLLRDTDEVDARSR